LVTSVPTIYHPELVKFIFVAFSEFRQKENDEGEKQISCLIAMLKYMLDLFKMKKNVSICAEKDVIRVILKEFSTILDAPSNSEARDPNLNFLGPAPVRSEISKFLLVRDFHFFNPVGSGPWIPVPSKWISSSIIFCLVGL